MALAVKAGGTGEVKELWRINRGSNVSAPVYLDGYLYYTHESGGYVYCVKAADGKIAYDKRLDPAPALNYASATYGDGKIYYVSRENGVYVLEASPTFKLGWPTTSSRTTQASSMAAPPSPMAGSTCVRTATCTASAKQRNDDAGEPGA